MLVFRFESHFCFIQNHFVYCYTLKNILTVLSGQKMVDLAPTPGLLGKKKKYNLDGMIGGENLEM